METEDAKSYRWEGGYERTWEALREDDSGNLVSDASAARRKKARGRLAAIAGTKLDLVRNLMIVLDLTKSMADSDFRIDKYPNRGAIAIRAIKEFIPLFFSTSPLSRLGIVTLQDRRAKRLVPLGASPKELNTKLNQLLEDGPKCDGQCSMVNGVKLCSDMLNSAGEDASKEIIFVIGAISTIDPEGPHQALNKVLVSQIRCSVVSLSAEVKIWKDLTEISGGCYYVPLDVPSVSEKLEILARPPKDTRSRQATLIRMGFPVREDKEKFICPQCKVRVAALPTAPFYEDDDENENEEKLNEQEKIFETIQPCVGCLDKPTTIEEAR